MNAPAGIEAQTHGVQALCSYKSRLFRVSCGEITTTKDTKITKRKI
jgi:hypothetical protein